MNNSKLQFITVAGLGISLFISTIPVNLEPKESSVLIKQPDFHPESSPMPTNTPYLTVVGITTSSSNLGIIPLPTKS